MVHAPCNITIKCCVEGNIFFFLWLEKHNGVYQKQQVFVASLFVSRFSFFYVETKKNLGAYDNAIR